MFSGDLNSDIVSKAYTAFGHFWKLVDGPFVTSCGYTCNLTDRTIMSGKCIGVKKTCTG